MSILIKGMKMPKKCEECPCYYYEYKECNAIGGMRVYGNATPPTDCPLVELPPHGRLIDADALKTVIQAHHDIFNNCGHLDLAGLAQRDGLTSAIAEIVNAPTIIEAETCNKSEDDGVIASIEAERGEE